MPKEPAAAWLAYSSLEVAAAETPGKLMLRLRIANPDGSTPGRWTRRSTASRGRCCRSRRRSRSCRRAEKARPVGCCGRDARGGSDWLRVTVRSAPRLHVHLDPRPVRAAERSIERLDHGGSGLYQGRRDRRTFNVRSVEVVIGAIPLHV